MVKRYIEDIKKYFDYSIRAGKSKLKAEVAFSHLSWMWWVLDPLLFMLVYSFVSIIVFGKSEQYFSAFIFVGYTSFQFFEKTLKTSVKLVTNNKTIVKNVYIPKQILMMTELYVNLFKCGISFSLVFVTMIFYRVPLSWRFIYFIPLLLLLIIFSEAVGMIVMHFGVYVEDLSNIINICLRLLFYMSGVFYSIGNRIHEDWIRFVLLKLNPIAFIMDQMRNCLLYNNPFHYKAYFAWLIVSLILFYFGIRIVYKNENGYVKVI